MKLPFSHSVCKNCQFPNIWTLSRNIYWFLLCPHYDETPYSRISIPFHDGPGHGLSWGMLHTAAAQPVVHTPIRSVLSQCRPSTPRCFSSTVENNVGVNSLLSSYVTFFFYILQFYVLLFCYKIRIFLMNWCSDHYHICLFSWQFSLPWIIPSHFFF